MYKFDTHVHTAETSPCGQILAKDLVRLYVEAGYSGFCITDHLYAPFLSRLGNIGWKEKMDHFLKGYRAAKDFGDKIGIDVLLAAEIQLLESKNEYLLFGLTENLLYEHQEIHTLSIKDLKKWATEHQILIFQAHPFRPGAMLQSHENIDGIEVINGNPRHDVRNDLAYAAAVENNFSISAGSDCHNLEDIGRSGIITRDRITSMNQLKDFLVSGLLQPILIED